MMELILPFVQTHDTYDYQQYRRPTDGDGQQVTSHFDSRIYIVYVCSIQPQRTENIMLITELLIVIMLRYCDVELLDGLSF